MLSKTSPIAAACPAIRENHAFRIQEPIHIDSRTIYRIDSIHSATIAACDAGETKTARLSS
jgi:hypothetical protein